MAEQLARFIEERLRIPEEQALIFLRRTIVGLAALSFVLFATLIVAFDSVFGGFNTISSLQVDDVSNLQNVVAPRDIVAPPNATPFISQILTDERRETARRSVEPIYFPPDPDIARRQIQTGQQILDYIENVRADIYATREQLIADLNAIEDLQLSEEIITAILQFDNESWRSIEDGIVNLLSREMQQEIRESDLPRVLLSLNNSVGPRYTPSETAVIVAIVEDLIRPNTFINEEATAEARESAAAAVEEQEVSFVSGQIIVEEGQPITPRVYEALQALNLLQSEDLRSQIISRAFVASVVVLVVVGLYLSRFASDLLYERTRLMSLVSAIFLLALVATRFLGIEGSIYLFPASAMSLLYVALVGPHVAIGGSLALAFLTGMMAGDSLQVAVLVASGGLIGALVLRRSERINSFFVTGAIIAVVEVSVIAIFNLATPTAAIGNVDITTQVILVLVSGIVLAPATAIAAMYIVTLSFNLPTALKLIDLSQPSKPLLQRLLREAPGTYQHSLQVANLAEQAANAIDGDAQLTYVAALYHDIGKMLNPLYFTENQQDTGNPHDTLNDPYRSADIIIGHVTEGDELARQYRLPQRIRDFIREHHGTTQVYVFYRQAVNAADGDESAVDLADFTYPGPRPQSRETAILMMADSCEAAVRSVKPNTKREISDLVGKIIDDKRRSGQLDQSGLTLDDIRTIQDTFVDILQGMFHPRINYRDAVDRKPAQPAPKTPSAPSSSSPAVSEPATTRTETAHVTDEEKSSAKPPRRPDKKDAVVEPMSPKARAAAADAPPRSTEEEPEETVAEIADEEPMTEVPRLPSMEERRTTGTHPRADVENGTDTSGETETQTDTDAVDDEADTPSS